MMYIYMWYVVHLHSHVCAYTQSYHMHIYIYTCGYTHTCIYTYIHVVRRGIWRRWAARQKRVYTCIFMWVRLCYGCVQLNTCGYFEESGNIELQGKQVYIYTRLYSYGYTPKAVYRCIHVGTSRNMTHWAARQECVYTYISMLYLRVGTSSNMTTLSRKVRLCVHVHTCG